MEGHNSDGHDGSSDHKDEDEAEVPCWRRTIKSVVAVTQKYSLPLITGVITALLWSNIDEDGYHDFTHAEIIPGFEYKGYALTSLHFLVNDIFMVFFFGLAIKEVTEAVLPGGSLSPIYRAVNPLFSTVGGVAGPIAVYIGMIMFFDAAGAFDGWECIVSGGSDASGSSGASGDSGGGVKEPCPLSEFIRGAGVPTATDISLAWMFAELIFGKGHPAVNSLLLLAIVDDALGMIMIAVFYKDPAKPTEPLYLIFVGVAMLCACIMRFFGVRYWSPYVFVCGPISWFGLLSAHVHPALALIGVVPFLPDKEPTHLPHHHHHHGHDAWHGEPGSPHSPAMTRAFTRSSTGLSHGLSSWCLQNVAEIWERIAPGMCARRGVVHDMHHHHHVHPPLHNFEHHLKLPVDFGMFFFGLANAGVQMGSIGGVTISVVLALSVGKTLGIAGCALLAVGIGFELPPGVTVADLFALSALGGVGLTVALFVSNEAFADPDLQGQAKMGAVISVACAGLAWLLRRFLTPCFPKARMAGGNGANPKKRARLAQSEAQAQRVAWRLGRLDAWKGPLDEMKVVHENCSRRNRLYRRRRDHTLCLHHLCTLFTLGLILTTGGFALAEEPAKSAITAFAAALFYYLEKHFRWAQKVESHENASGETIALLTDLEHAIMNYCSRVSMADDALTLDEELCLAARVSERYRTTFRAIEVEYPLTYKGKTLPLDAY